MHVIMTSFSFQKCVCYFVASSALSNSRLQKKVPLGLGFSRMEPAEEGPDAEKEHTVLIDEKKMNANGGIEEEKCTSFHVLDKLLESPQLSDVNQVVILDGTHIQEEVERYVDPESDGTDTMMKIAENGENVDNVEGKMEELDETENKEDKQDEHEITQSDPNTDDPVNSAAVGPLTEEQKVVLLEEMEAEFNRTSALRVSGLGGMLNEKVQFQWTSRINHLFFF